MATIMCMPSEMEITERRLEGEVAVVCGHLNALHTRLVDVVADVIATRAWEGAGIHSPAQWLAWQSGLSPERARQIVVIAERREELPLTMAAFGDGLLSVDQVAVVATRAPAHNDREACELALSATVTQLRRALSKHCFPPAPKPTDDRRDDASTPASSPERRASAGFGDGDFFLHACADPVDGALIMRALAEAKDALFRGGDADTTWLDSLVEVCRRSLGSIASPSRRDLYGVIVHLDGEGAWIHNGPAIPKALADYILCDGRVRPQWSEGGLPINVGRRRHIVPNQTRIAIEDRDRMCRHPACSSSIGLEVHHVIHWNGPGLGETVTWNLCCLCARHHRAHHHGEFTIVGNADDRNGLTFRDARGRVIQPCGRPVPPGADTPPSPRKPYAHPTGERFDYRWLYFKPPPAA
ncbi:MAG: hypothetical protein JWL72_1596 [Ilumatobacteraceae bacterium]|nr:hypothetical protein [Ilumatobacteraceae bacterium]